MNLQQALSSAPVKAYIAELVEEQLAVREAARSIRPPGQEPGPGARPSMAVLEAARAGDQAAIRAVKGRQASLEARERPGATEDGSKGAAAEMAVLEAARRVPAGHRGWREQAALRGLNQTTMDALNGRAA